MNIVNIENVYIACHMLVIAANNNYTFIYSMLLAYVAVSLCVVSIKFVDCHRKSTQQNKRKEKNNNHDINSTMYVSTRESCLCSIDLPPIEQSVPR